MQTESHFQFKSFADIQIGDFFFHHLSSLHAPAMRVKNADGKTRIVDLNFEYENGKRFPTIVAEDDLLDLPVIAVPKAVLRTASTKAEDLQSGSLGNAPVGALLLSSAGFVLRISNRNIGGGIRVAVDSGLQIGSLDSSKYAWTAAWEIIVRDPFTGASTVLFSRA